MLKIGEFSKLSRVSVRMLRHYDEIGLLKPAETDRFTDYRYYKEDQLPIVGRIAALKDMGFSLADIVRILEVYDDREKLEQFFSARQEELETLSKDTAYKLTLLDAARKRLRKEEDMYHHWKDFQQEYCELFPMDHVMSLEKAVNYCGVEFKGRAHDGLNDARATADLYRAIHDKESFKEFQEKVLDCFRPKSISHTLADLFDFSAFQTAMSGT